jgi:membrane-bound lytic murein transglycosylase B
MSSLISTSPCRRARLVAIAAVTVGLAFLASGCASPAPMSPSASPTPVEAPPVLRAERAPAGVPPTDPGIAGMVDAGWAAKVAAATGIPERAVLAYAGATIFVENQNATCHIGWNTLAGVGEVESHHGNINGSTLDAAGNAIPPIFGIPLDGQAVNNIPDSDKGLIDGDPTIDRAVGPMQFIPESWRNWGIDGSANGVIDPQNIDDAALSTANYLCHAGGDLADPDGWRTAIAAYNDAGPYAASVSAAAIQYAEAATAAGLAN